MRARPPVDAMVHSMHGPVTVVGGNTPNHDRLAHAPAFAVNVVSGLARAKLPIRQMN